MNGLMRGGKIAIPLFLYTVTLNSAAIAAMGTVTWSPAGAITFCDTGGGISYTPKFNYQGSSGTNQCCPKNPNGSTSCQFTLHYDDGSQPDSTSGGVGSTAASGSVTSNHGAYTLTGFPGSANYYTVVLQGWCRSVIKTKTSTTLTPVMFYTPSAAITVYGAPCPQ